jgi:hypothetical protein
MVSVIAFVLMSCQVVVPANVFARELKKAEDHRAAYISECESEAAELRAKGKLLAVAKVGTNVHLKDAKTNKPHLVYVKSQEIKDATLKAMGERVEYLEGEVKAAKSLDLLPQPTKEHESLYSVFYFSDKIKVKQVFDGENVLITYKYNKPDGAVDVVDYVLTGVNVGAFADGKEMQYAIPLMVVGNYSYITKDENRRTVHKLVPATKRELEVLAGIKSKESVVEHELTNKKATSK